mmetsp:Transcript_21874/g.36221  ORF Transcript_21874/g.36221 Transcript_21874/m.36221 type:complete len:191 (+) Transcript_21874:116-688(+)
MLEFVYQFPAHIDSRRSPHTLLHCRRGTCSRLKRTHLEFRCSAAESVDILSPLSTEGFRVREGHFEGQRHIGQKAFPLVITPADGFGPSLDDALEWVKNSKPKIESALYDHLAILFRGFPARSPEEFDRFLGAFQYDDVNIRKSIFGSVRRLLEASPFEYIWLHHEDPLFPRPISKIFFMCEEPAKEGQV